MSRRARALVRWALLWGLIGGGFCVWVIVQELPLWYLAAIGGMAVVSLLLHLWTSREDA